MSELALYRRLLRQARPYWLHLAGLFGIGLLASPLALLDPVPLKIVFDSVLGSHPLPVYVRAVLPSAVLGSALGLLVAVGLLGSEEHTSELQSQSKIVCRLLLLKKKKKYNLSATRLHVARTADQ